VRRPRAGERTTNQPTIQPTPPHLCPTPPPQTGGTLIPYTLDEKHNWALSIDSLRKSVQEARAAGKCVRGLVFINPGAGAGWLSTAG
jgi:hypothetical protein